MSPIPAAPPTVFSRLKSSTRLRSPGAGSVLGFGEPGDLAAPQPRRFSLAHDPHEEK